MYASKQKRFMGSSKGFEKLSQGFRSLNFNPQNQIFNTNFSWNQSQNTAKTSPTLKNQNF